MGAYTHYINPFSAQSEVGVVYHSGVFIDLYFYGLIIFLLWLFFYDLNRKHLHPYHIVDYSPWPYLGGSGAFLLTVGIAIYFHYCQTLILNLGVILLTSAFLL